MLELAVALHVPFAAFRAILEMSLAAVTETRYQRDTEHTAKINSR